MEGSSSVKMKGSVSNVSKCPTTPKYSRWNPTGEQLRQLEYHYYGKGLRRPTEEHILEITAELKCLGKADRKNVFYWFQNREARYRRTQRQENVPDTLVKQMNQNRRCQDPNGNCGCTDGSHYPPQNEMEAQPKNSKVCPPCGTKRNPRARTVAVNAKNRSTEHPHQQRTITEHNLMNNVETTRETLMLFPLHRELNNTPTSSTVDLPGSSSQIPVEGYHRRYAQPNNLELFPWLSY